MNLRFSLQTVSVAVTAVIALGQTPASRQAREQYFAQTEEEKANPGLQGVERERVQRKRASLRLVVMISAELNDSPVVGAGVVFARGPGKVYVTTANHVVRRGSAVARNLKVTLKDNPSVALNAELLSHFDAASDVAVLAADTRGIKDLDTCLWFLFQLSDARELKRGEVVYAVGNPNGFGWGTSVSPEFVAQVEQNRIMFQSTFLSPGHSGGALLDKEWRLVGMIQGDQPPYGSALILSNALEQIRRWGYLVELYQPNQKFESVLEEAIAGGDLNVARQIVANCPNVNAQGFRMRTPLNIALRYEQVGAVKFLIESGADVNAVTADVNAFNAEKDSETPLQIASFLGNIETVKVLLAAGASVSARDGHDWTPLHSAASGGGREVIDLLCKHGADANAVARRAVGRTPLHIAAGKKQLEAVNALLACGAKVDARDDSAWTPLHWAADTLQPAMVRTLLAAGADVNAKTDGMMGNRTPLGLVLVRGGQQGNRELQDLLRSHGGKK